MSVIIISGIYVISHLSVVPHCMSFTIACTSPLSDISHCLSFPSICHSLLSVIPPLSAIPIICPSPLCYFSFSCHFPLSIIANCLLFTLSVIMLIYISLEPWTCSKHVVITWSPDCDHNNQNKDGYLFNNQSHDLRWPTNQITWLPDYDHNKQNKDGYLFNNQSHDLRWLTNQNAVWLPNNSDWDGFSILNLENGSLKYLFSSFFLKRKWPIPLLAHPNHW